MPASISEIQPHFSFDEAKSAYDQWGANCGPGALAAIVGLSLDEIRPLMGDFESKGYTNPKLMIDCLKRVQVFYVQLKPAVWPMFGLARIQWIGPWMKEGVPMRARYRHTHWVGTARINGDRGVFDINCMNNGSGWVSFDEWASLIAPFLAKGSHSKATGEWSLTHGIEVRTEN